MDEAEVSTEKDESEYVESYESAVTDEPVPPSDIVAYNELRSCADLFRIYESEKLDIQPDFQRDVVWQKDEQTRFIDSLVKQLPIPSMCFSLDFRTQKWKVIDGLQRMTSIIRFLGAAPADLSDIEDIHPLLRGASNVTLRKAEEGKKLISIVQDMSIPITVIRCDYSQDSHMQYLFTIFHRLNSGGVRLNNQEIRNCIYSGGFNTTLKNFDRTNKDWAAIKKRIWGKVDRFRSVEVLLRALTFSARYERYDGNLAKFLNNYMHDCSKDPQLDLNLLTAQLSEMATQARRALGVNERGKISLTVVEAVLVGVLRNLEESAKATTKKLQANFRTMVESKEFKEAARYAVAGEKNVKARMQFASNIFS